MLQYNTMSKAEIQPGKTANVGFLQRGARIAATAILSPTFLRSEVTKNKDSIKKAKEALKSGKGLIVIINHFSLKDPPQATNELFHHTVTGSKRIIAPIAFHRDNPWLHRIGKIFGHDLAPIVTENTIREGKNDGHKKNDGIGEYIAESTKLLKKGGIVILAPQGTRMPRLGQPDPNNLAVGSLMASARKNGVKDYVFLFMGLGIQNTDRYSQKTRGFNPFKKYTLNVGACLTSEEILIRAGDNFRNVDAVIFRELDRTVPPNYR